MESPIKDLVNKYPVAIKPYKADVPRDINNKGEHDM